MDSTATAALLAKHDFDILQYAFNRVSLRKSSISSTLHAFVTKTHEISGLVSCPINKLALDWPISDAEGLRIHACIPEGLCA